MTVHARDDQRTVGLGDASSSAGFETFFREHYRSVVRLAQSVVGEAQAAQDVAQDVFLAAYRRFPDNYEQAVGWVRVAAVHTALNALRGERRRDKRQLLAASGGSMPSTEDTVMAREGRAELRRVLARLPHRSAAALVMRHGGLSYAEIADGLGVKVGHVGTLLRRAESSFRQEMDRETRS
jgi:RNA polymerase sigma factor (sigma-70 family)